MRLTEAVSRREHPHQRFLTQDGGARARLEAASASLRISSKSRSSDLGFMFLTLSLIGLIKSQAVLAKNTKLSERRPFWSHQRNNKVHRARFAAPQCPLCGTSSKAGLLGKRRQVVRQILAMLCAPLEIQRKILLKKTVRGKKRAARKKRAGDKKRGRGKKHGRGKKRVGVKKQVCGKKRVCQTKNIRPRWR